MMKTPIYLFQIYIFFLHIIILERLPIPRYYDNVTFCCWKDCLFDGLEGSGVDAVYANPMICGTFASSYPPPFIIIR